MINRRGIVLLSGEAGDYWRERLVHSGLNVIGIHPGGGETTSQSLKDTIAIARTPQFQQFCIDMTANGIAVEYEAHALSWMLPRPLFSRHPEWFRMNAGGERTPDYNICFTNPDAIAQVEESAERLAGLLVSSTDRYYYWSDDVGGDCFCHCKECSKYSPSEQYLLFSNAVLRGLRRVNPKAIHAYLAYVCTLPAPRRVEPEDGIFLEYAPIGRDQSVPIDDPSSEKNVREIGHLDALLSCFGRKDAQVLEYWLDNSRFSNWRLPYQKLSLDTDTMRRDVEFYLERGFDSVTSFGCWLDKAYFDQYGEPPVTEYAKILCQSSDAKNK